jgi:hypothetical protein
VACHKDLSATTRGSLGRDDPSQEFLNEGQIEVGTGPYFVIPDLAADTSVVVTNLVRRVDEKDRETLRQRHFREAHLRCYGSSVGDTKVSVRTAASMQDEQRTAVPRCWCLPQHKALQTGRRHYLTRPSRTLTLQFLRRWIGRCAQT